MFPHLSLPHISVSKSHSQSCIQLHCISNPLLSLSIAQTLPIAVLPPNHTQRDDFVILRCTLSRSYLIEHQQSSSSSSPVYEFARAPHTNPRGSDSECERKLEWFEFLKQFSRILVICFAILEGATWASLTSSWWWAGCSLPRIPQL
jgi:hypothetical protein